MQAIILAGGKGSRLYPYTKVLPKPLIPVGEEPIAEILVKQLQHAGFDEIIMCLGYLADLIIAYFQDGSRLGLPIRYVTETSPLGTAAPLKNVTRLAEDFLVVNADVLTTLNFAEIYARHVGAHADMTIAVQKKLIPSPFGVLEIKDGRVISYREKPSHNYWASIGIYILNKRVLQFIPENKQYDMPDLVQSLLNKQASIISYESDDLWFDIGTLGDLEKAQDAIADIKVDQNEGS